MAPPTKPYRVALMARVSTLKQGEKPMSLPEQYRICHEYAEAKGWKVVAVLEDRASGMKWDRPGLLEAVGLAKQEAIDGVLALNHDRLCRDDDVRGWFKIELRQHNARIHYAEAPDEADTPEDRLVGSVLSAAVRYVRDKVLVNTTKGRVARVRDEGKILHNGFAPLGYALNEEKTAYVEDEDESPWVEAIFQRYADGQSATKIADWLNNEPGAPRPSRGGDDWARSSVATILAREDYTGSGTRLDWQVPEDEHGRPLRRSPVKTGDGVVLEFPQIVPDRLWRQVQAMRAEASHRTSLNRADVDPDAALLLGTGRVICAGCNKPMSYERPRVTKGRLTHARYRCRRRGCPSRASYHQEPIDELVWDTVRRVVMDKRFLEDRYRASLGAGGGLDAEVDRATAVVTGLDRKRKNLLTQLADLGKSDPLLGPTQEQLREVLAKLLPAQQREAGLLRQRARAKEDMERLRDFGAWLARHREGFESLDMEGRRRLTALAGIQVRVASVGYGKHVAWMTGGVTSDDAPAGPDRIRVAEDAYRRAAADPGPRGELTQKVLAAHAAVGGPALGEVRPDTPHEDALRDVIFNEGPSACAASACSSTTAPACRA